jgi:hypothetical protein
MIPDNVFIRCGSDASLFVDSGTVKSKGFLAGVSFGEIDRRKELLTVGLS